MGIPNESSLRVAQDLTWVNFSLNVSDPCGTNVQYVSHKPCQIVVEFLTRYV